MDEKKYLRDGRAPIPKKAATSRVMSANKAKDTKPELLLRKALFHNGLSGYRIHWKKVPGRPDIAYPGKRIAIFVNGCYWHRCPNCEPSFPKTNVEFWENKFQKNMERDERKKRELEEAGWKIFVFWECKIKEDVGSCVEQVRSFIINQAPIVL